MSAFGQTGQPAVELTALLRAHAENLPSSDTRNFADSFDRFADARVVLLGEATHGTHEFYAARARITRHLIERHGFNIVAVEGDWPDIARIDDYVREGAPRPTGGEPFARFPTWMWRNQDVLAFADWLRGHNAPLPQDKRASIRGLDVYSLGQSIAAVIGYLDRHMFDTLQTLMAHTRDARVVVWAHNSHVGNAAATAMGWQGEFNIGELVRKAYGDQAVLIGFGTDRGTVAAASDWGSDMQVMAVKPARDDSWEAAFRSTGLARSLTDWRGGKKPDLVSALSQVLLERAIGVVYRPRSELTSHYFQAVLAEQFDAWVWFEETRAVSPLGHERPHGVPETWPFGL